MQEPPFGIVEPTAPRRIRSARPGCPAENRCSCRDPVRILPGPAGSARAGAHAAPARRRRPGHTGPVPDFTVPASVRAILLDIDGVLVNHRSAADAASWQWARALPGWGLGPQETAERWEALDRKHFTRYQHGELDFDEQLRARIRDFVPGGADISDAEADAHMAAYRSIYRSLWRAYDDVPDFLARLRAWQGPDAGGNRTRADTGRTRAVAYLTNGDEAQQRDKLDAVGALVEGWPVLASKQLGATKPDPAVFRAACARLGAAETQTLMIGDEAWSDIDGATGAGLVCVHLRRSPSAPVRDVPWVDALARIYLP